MNNMGAARVMTTKRPRAVRGKVPVPESLRAFSSRDKTLVAIGEDVKRESLPKFEVGSSSKAGNEDFDKAVGKRLAYARRVMDMSADDAAEQLRISKQALYKYEKGERTLKAKTLYDAARLYGVDGSWLLCLTDDLMVTRTDEKGRTVTVTYRV